MIKTGIIYETLGSVNNMQIVESSNPNEVRLSGVFGVCGVRNDNHRIYEKANYGKCLEALQTKIAGNQALGELEHPNSMNINLENVSHMIESIKMNEDGTVTGTVKLLNTPKGQIAKAIVEGGAPLFISSRAAGSVDGKGNVTLQSIATYDLVGTPGFSQAKLTAENKTFECLNESLENPCWMIVESETPEDGDEETPKKDEKKKCPKCDKEECECEKKEVKEAGDVESATIKESEENADEETSKDEPKADEDKSKEEDSKENNSKEDEPNKEEENNENNDNKVNMEDLKKSIDALAEKVSSLEAQLHVAQESLETTQAELNEAKEIIAANEIDYDVIQEWLTSEFAPELATQLNESIADGVQNWVVNEFGAKLETWITEEFAGTVQNWITEEYSAELQKWINEEYSAELQKWINEEYSAELQNWICEHFASEVENWVCEEFGSAMQDYITEEVMPEYENLITEKLSSNVSEYLASEKANDKAAKMSNVDAMLEKLAAKASKMNESKEIAKEVIAESSNSKFKGVFVVESMPAQYRPMFEALSDDKQEEIVRSARMYDFTKPNALESFWAGQNFNVNQIIIESKDDNMNHSAFAGVANMMKKLSGRI